MEALAREGRGEQEAYSKAKPFECYVYVLITDNTKMLVDGSILKSNTASNLI
jgi:hypothetical protein